MAGVEVPSAKEVIAERIKNGSQPGFREDPYLVSLILQGGAMGGIYAAGAGLYLMSTFGETFPLDLSHTTSGGTASDSYLKSGNGADGTSIYYDELSRGFIGWSNILKRRRFIDLSLMINAMRSGPKQLDFNRLLAHPAESNFFATSVEDARIINFKIGQTALESTTELEFDGEMYICYCQTPEDILAAIEASCHLPFYAGPPVRIKNELLAVDGGVSRAARIPLNMAINDGCSHILIFASEKKYDEHEYRISLEEKVAALAIRQKYPALAEHYWEGHNAHQDTLSLLREIEDGEIHHPKVDIIWADDQFVPKQRETNPRNLYLAAVAGRQAAAKAFEEFNLIEDPAIKLRPPKTVAI